MAYYTYYVYTLAYPDGRIFYVGKGQGDRIYQHEREARQYDNQSQKSANVRVIREIWAAGGKVVKTKVFETMDEEEANQYEKQFIAQCDPHTLTNRTKGGGPLFSARDPYARLKHREYYYSPKEAFEKLGVSDQVWHRLFLSGVLHFYQSEGCTLPVLLREEIDDFAVKIKNGSYPIDAWEMAAPNSLKTVPPEKRSLWWDDEPPRQQAGRQYPMSKLEMLREATATALNAAQQASSEPCYLVGSYIRESHQAQQDEPAWDVIIRVGQEQYSYIVKLEQDQFVITNAPIKPTTRSEKPHEASMLPALDENFHDHEACTSIDQITSEDDNSLLPDTPTVTQPSAPKPVTTTEAPRLSIVQVKKKWEYVLRRIKSRKDGAKVAAILNGYVIVGVNDSADLPIVILKAKSLFHYNAIEKGGYQPFIEWALMVELEQKCRLLLLAPEASNP